MRFHRKCGDRITLLNHNCTAVRNFVEFNHGLILSEEPLEDEVIFEVSIDRKVNIWNGSLEIGVTTVDPELVELPATATKLRNTAWVMSGSSILRDGVAILNGYGPELDTLKEGDTLGVVRTNKAELMFYVNGTCLGTAVKEMPQRLFAVIDLYGQCVQVSIIQDHSNRTLSDSTFNMIEEDCDNDISNDGDLESVGLDQEPCNAKDIYVPMTLDNACALVARDKLRFHSRCGILIKLSPDNKSAERTRPLDDYNNGVVATHRPLYDGELFEIRIDKLVDKWSGSIEMGVTTHNPSTMRFPSTMTNMYTGTVMMSGCKVLINGHGTCMEYGTYNLDDLKEGDTIGMMKKPNGELHYYINGVDQGIACDKLEEPVWGVVDLYGMTVKVTIIDPCEDLEVSNVSYSPPLITNISELPHSGESRSKIEDELLFHTLRDSNVVIINDGKTAHRPNAFETFNNGIVTTNRTLRTNEIFQVRLDIVIPKWAGSIEIGVTQNSSNDIQPCYKLTNLNSRAWAMAGEDVVYDGMTIIPQYARNLDKLVEGDTVGVVRRDMGILHFYVNNVDQGPAAFNIPEHVFGVIDLYGRVGQATLVNSFPLRQPVLTPDSPLSSDSNSGICLPEMCFHTVHGRNARLSRSRATASRRSPRAEFNEALVFSARPLRECAMFELRVDTLVDCWIGSIEIGVTALRPEEVPRGRGGGAGGTATELRGGTYVLSGAGFVRDGECVRPEYPLDLDSLTVGSRVGMMWHSDKSLHYYLDGMDMGKAWYVPHINVYAVVDLYGQCTQVTLMQNEERTFNYNGRMNSDNSLVSRPLASPPPLYWSFSEYCGENVCVCQEFSVARRAARASDGCLVFSATHLAYEELFEIKIVECKYNFAGCFRMGVTDVNILNAHVNTALPPSLGSLPHFTAYVEGPYLKRSCLNGRHQELRTVTPGTEWLRPGDKLGLKKVKDRRVAIYYNGEMLDTFIDNVPEKVYVVMDLCGHVNKIQAVSRSNFSAALSQPTRMHDTTNHDFKNRIGLPYTLHRVHGANIKLCSSGTVALRTRGYNDALVVSSRPLYRGCHFKFRVDKATAHWHGSLAVGALRSLPESLPDSITSLEPPVWYITTEMLCNNRTYRKTDMAACLAEVTERSVVTLRFKLNGDLVVDINKFTVTIGSVPKLLAGVYPIIDLYGRVTQISVLLHPHFASNSTSVDLASTRKRKETRPAFDDCFSHCSSPSASRYTKSAFKTYSQDNLTENSFDNQFKTAENTFETQTPRRCAAIRESKSLQSFANRKTPVRGTISLENCHYESAPAAGDEGLLDFPAPNEDNFVVLDSLEAFECGNVPVFDEGSFSTDGSCKADDLESLTVANCDYLSRILTSQRDNSAESSQNDCDREAEGSRCSHLKLVLKYWRSVTCTFPELRHAASWGQVACHCAKCDPTALSHLAGWVRVGRTDGFCRKRAYWRANRRGILNARRCSGSSIFSRPRLTPEPQTTPDLATLWLDEKGKPHQTILTLEIDVESTDPKNDRLLAVLLYLKSADGNAEDNSQ